MNLIRIICHFLVVRPWNWYLGAWWHPCLVLLLTGAICFAFNLPNILLAKRLIPTWLEILPFACLMFELLIGIPAGIVLFIRKRWGRGLLLWGEGALIGTAVLFGMIVLVFFSMFRDEDHFADHLKLPENIVLLEPENSKSSRPGDHWEKPENSFQAQVIRARKTGKPMPDNETGALPSLEKKLAEPDGKNELIRYLACNPEWRLYRERRETLYATRRARSADGKPVSSLHNYFSWFAATQVVTDQYGKDKFIEPDRRDDYQFRTGIGLDGNSWNRRNNTARVECRKTGDSQINATTVLRAGDAIVEIFDQSGYPGRRMTRKMLELLDSEFAQLVLPSDAVKHGNTPEFTLFNGGQPGIYTAEVRCNPGEMGTLYLKAYEITTGARLSENRLESACNEIPGWSSNPAELFFSLLDFTIYEGNWDQYYGARLELWFRPSSGAPERKILERNYRIQGWMR